jgi:peptidyl-Lys metalloendopeptidase
MRRSFTLLAFVFIAICAAGATAGQVQGELNPRLELENPKGWIAGDEAVTLRFTIENRSAESLQVLRWQTPQSGIEHNLFQVLRDGLPVAYTGKLVKRAAPQPEDYLVIQAWGSLSVVFDPSASYDMVQAGEYTIRYRASLMGVKSESNTVTFFMEGLPQAFNESLAKGVNCNAKPCHPKCPPNPELCGGGGGGTVEFVACTSQQQGKALTAVDNATTISEASATDLADGSSPLYETWFGAYKASRYNTVTSNFQSIASAFANETVTINCTDADLGYYAYVYPGNPYEIYVCYYFFHAPNMGRDSAAGTLVHEMSHFNVVAGTDDYVYGETGALNLAQTSPRRAINNADNYEYFAEDH